jgi:3-phenylpropionate/cinnamic acid dioxygenase small subunit
MTPMTNTNPTITTPARDLEYYRLKEEVEEFLFEEAELLDQRQFQDWLALLTDDLVYFMPMRRNVKFGQHAQHENTRLGSDISWFDEDKWTLTKRVDQILTGVHWAEEPFSRVSHLVTNVRLAQIREAGTEVVATCRFLVYQNRGEYETNFFVGKRTDTLRRDSQSGTWKLARREILLDQSVLLAKSLTTFF